MTSFIAVLAVVATLFFISFFTKRRFGFLGLALCAGALLSLYWADMLTPFLEKQGVQLVTPPLSAIVQIVLVLAPPLLILLNSPSYAKIIPRIIGSLAFAVLAMTFLSDTLVSVLVVNDVNASIFKFLHEHKNTLIVIGVVAAVFDVVLTRKFTSRKDSKKNG